MAPTKFRFFTKQMANKHAYTNYIDATKNKSTYIHEKQLIDLFRGWEQGKYNTTFYSPIHLWE